MSKHDCLETTLIVKKNESLASYNTWGVGGSAQYLFQPSSRKALSEFLKDRDRKLPLTILGLGSNVLIPDEGLKGYVVLLYPGLAKAELLANGNVYFEAGLTCAKAARFCQKAGYEEGAFWAGIPGTIGGAIAMNAGCFGGQTWDFLLSVDTMDENGEVYHRKPHDYAVTYRSVVMPNPEIFLAATFKFSKEKSNEMSKEETPIKALLRRRNETQPIGLRSCGSVFKNPKGDHAARLIEAVGLKGYEIGGAQVSLKHANFVINTGEARAADIKALITLMQARVYEKFGIRLEPEVRFL